MFMIAPFKFFGFIVLIFSLLFRSFYLVHFELVKLSFSKGMEECKKN